MITLVKDDQYFLVFDSVVSFFVFFFLFCFLFFCFFFFVVYGVRYSSAKTPFLSITDGMQLECDDVIH